MVFMFDPSTNSFGNNSTFKELYKMKQKNLAANLMLTYFNSFKCTYVIHDLFKDAISSSDNTVSCGALINE